jgi:hypothetical protein
MNPVNYEGVIINVNYGTVETRFKARFNPIYVLDYHSINEQNLLNELCP